MKQASIAPELKLRCVRVSHCHSLNSVTIFGLKSAADAVVSYFCYCLVSC